MQYSGARVSISPTSAVHDQLSCVAVRDCMQHTSWPLLGCSLPSLGGNFLNLWVLLVGGMTSESDGSLASSV